MTATTLKEITFILKQLSARNNPKRLLPLQKSTLPCFSCYEHLTFFTTDNNFFSDVEDTYQHPHHYTDQHRDDQLHPFYTGKQIIP